MKNATMHRRKFITILGGAAAAWPLAARAQQRERVRRIGWLSTTGEQDPQNQAHRRAFHQEFAKLGWTDGQNFRIEYRSTSGEDDSRARTLAMEIVTMAPDVILTTGTQFTAILKQQTNTIPIVFVTVADPVVSGLVASFARPSGNITGFTNVESSFVGKWLSILKDIAPGITRVMILYNPANPNWIDYLRTIEAAAPALRVTVSAAPVNHADEIARQIEPFVREPRAGMIVLPSGLMVNNRAAMRRRDQIIKAPVRGANDIVRAIDTFATEPNGALLMSPDNTTLTHRETINRLAVQHRLPTMFAIKFHASEGGLMAYATDTVDLYRRAAAYVDRLLRGAKVSELPVQFPTKFELVVNLKTAKAIGLTIPETFLVRADEIIE